MAVHTALLVAALLALASVPSAVEAHGFIKEWGVKGQTLEKAQKTDIKASSFRAVASNTGWIGSQCTFMHFVLPCRVSPEPLLASPR